MFSKNEALLILQAIENCQPDYRYEGCGETQYLACQMCGADLYCDFDSKYANKDLEEQTLALVHETNCKLLELNRLAEDIKKMILSESLP